MDNPGRHNIDQFEALMMREDRQRGLFVAFSFTRDAEQECAAATNASAGSSSRELSREILAEEFVQKM